MFQAILRKFWPHAIVLAVFAVVTSVYFSLQLSGYGLKQHDILQHKGSSHEISDYRDRTGSETLWTNSMFGGMPSMQVSLLYEGNYINNVVTGFVKSFPPPAGVVLLLMIGFYIFALCMRINPWIGLFGSLVFAFATYNLVILQAGHNSKAMATAFMAPVLGAFLMSWRDNLKWGVVLSALFMTMELSMNHLQVTYYFLMLLVPLGAVLFFQTAFVQHNFKKAMMTVGGLAVAYGIAALINFGNITLTNDYAKYSIRGGNDVTLMPNGQEDANKTSGLDKDYINEYSNSIDESWTLVSPYVKGSAAGAMRNTPFAETVENSDLSLDEKNKILDGTASYWGEQPIVSGPAYIGIVVVFLAILAVTVFPSAVNVTFLIFAFLALALSWGKNFAGLSEFMIDYLPGYNKFRAPTIIAVVIQLCCAFLAVRFLEQLWRERENITSKKNIFLISSGLCLAILFGLRVVGLDDHFLTAREQQQLSSYPQDIKNQILSMDPAQIMQQTGVDVSKPDQLQSLIDQQANGVQTQFANLEKIRQTIFNDSVTRSIWLLILAIGIVALFFYTKARFEIILGVLVVVATADLITVDKEYLGNQEEGMGYRYWEDKNNTLYPITARDADIQIMKLETMNPAVKAEVDKGASEGTNKANELNATGIAKTRIIDAARFAALNRSTNYRVFDYTGGFNSAEASYFHKSLGGYHGAKLRNIQNVYDYHIVKQNQKVFDMLNVKYMIKPQGQTVIAEPNMNALGNAWFVKRIETVKDANTEIRSIGNRFAMKNVGNGVLMVNGKTVTNGEAYGSDEAKYILNKDTLDVPLSNMLTPEFEVYFVMDVNGATNLVPKMTLDADTSKSFLRLVSYKVSNEFVPKEEAIMLEDQAKKIKSKVYSGEGMITMKKYAPNEITYEANAKGKQFAVFSEIYYPEGWTATIDGKEVEIKKVNYLLRGLEIPEGNHQIKFSFDLPSYHRAGMLAMTGTLLILIMLLGAAYTDWKRRKKEPMAD